MKILFVCRANMFRSQVAEALFKKISEGTHEVKSAGTLVQPSKEKIRVKDNKSREIKLLIEVMGETEDIDLSQNESKPLTQSLVDWADKVICMAQRETIPEYLLQSGKMEYWTIEDSSPGAEYDFFIDAIERIKKKIQKLVEEIDG